MNSVHSERARSFPPFRALLLIFCALTGLAQQLPPATPFEPGTAISVDVRLVVLHASVRDKKGAVVSGLRQRNFEVNEDGQRQTIRSFQAEDIPVAVGLVVDNSGSMSGKRSDVNAAAAAFTRSSNPGDQIFIVKFNERVTLGLPDTKLFSASAAELESVLLKPAATGKTALYDAISEAIAHVRQSRCERKALIVISDGADNASKRTLGAVLQEIAQSDVTIFTIGLFDEDAPDQNPQVLGRIAKASGGEAFLPRKASHAVQTCERIARDIRAQYTLSYSPANQSFGGEYRTIRIKVTDEHGSRLQVRAREGYTAPADKPMDKDEHR
jgi:Ca-activated chloride channel homolog